MGLFKKIKKAITKPFKAVTKPIKQIAKSVFKTLPGLSRLTGTQQSTDRVDLRSATRLSNVSTRRPGYAELALAQSREEKRQMILAMMQEDLINSQRST